MTYTQQDCINALKEAADELGRSPEYAEYKISEYYPSISAIEHHFGSFNAAKEAAGLKTNNRGQQPKSVDESYFEEINNVETAYWLGFITGDGGVYRENPTDKFSIELHSKDRDHLVKLQKAIGSEHDLTASNGGVQFSVQNQEFIDGLLNHGVYYDKTFNGGLPKLSKQHLKQAFVRGLSDADGTLSLDYNWRIASGNKRRLEEIQDWLPVESHITGSDCYVLAVVGKSTRKPTVISWLYPSGEDTEPALSRKKEQANPFW